MFHRCHIQALFIFILSNACISYSSEVLRPRGVAISKAPLYEVGDKFSCLDGSISIPYTHVNDDYCDCSDGSDEPGTSACTQGYFHCTNAGHKPKYIRSSLVNDGICDCCDTSDEYNSSAQCVNDCKELGKKAREEAAAIADMMKSGFEKKTAFSIEGKKKKEQMKIDHADLIKRKEEAAKIKSELEAVKNEIEGRETAALEKYKSEEEERKKLKEEEDMRRYMAAEKEQATQYFRLLDKDGDGKLYAVELMDDVRFDQNRDGTVQEEEAKFFLHMKDYLELEEYTTTGWMIMKPIVTSQLAGSESAATEAPLTEQPDIVEPEPPTEEPATEEPEAPKDDDYESGEKYEEEVPEEYHDPEEPEVEEFEEDDEDDVPEETRKKDRRLPKRKREEEPKEEGTVYDEETQKIVDEAKKARDDYHDADNKLSGIESEINALQEKIDRDYGVDEEYALMQDECFEFQHIEYVYKLCPFNRASQAPKSGGSETSLGTWGKWNGPDNNKYSQMLYENGQGCWNGPNRSAKVQITCGLENKLTAVSEPSRCTYLFEFETPAACSQPASADHSNHDEL